MTTRQTHPFAGATRKPPTNKHRPAIWENMLGTVYAMDDHGEVRYFDYNWDDARAFAGFAADRDPRIAKASSANPAGWALWRLPHLLNRRQTALWLLKTGDSK
jgi:hypothetical protein